MPRGKDEAECHHACRHQCHGIIMASRPPEGKEGEKRKEKKFDGIRHRELQRIVTWDWVQEVQEVQRGWYGANITKRRRFLIALRAVGIESVGERSLWHR